MHESNYKAIVKFSLYAQNVIQYKTVRKTMKPCDA